MELSTKQQLFLDAALAGENLFLTGEAGTGKSHVVKLAIEQLQKRKKNVVVIAPTGVAATNIGGQTIHSMFSLRPFGVLDFEACSFVKSEKRRVMSIIDTIVIDEISMLRPDMLDGINWTLLKNGCKGLNKIQLILVGDMEQVEAVVDDNMRSVLLAEYHGVEFYHAKIWEKLPTRKIELDEVLRQNDPDFISALNVIRKRGKSEYFRQFVSTEPRGVVLAPHNATVNKYNLAGLEAEPGVELKFTAHITGNAKASDFKLESEIRVKHGCKIMYLQNSKNNNLVNGTCGIFCVEDGRYFIKVGDVKYALERVHVAKIEYVLNKNKDGFDLVEIGSIEQYPFKLAYALSIHKSQGMTMDEVTLDLTLPCFARGQMYVALSRVRTPDGLTIITK
jgi:ATP-dependent DNA helicase PIF1